MILDVGCHYLVQVKRNCRKLWESVALHTALGPPMSVCEYYQDNHGHQVWRRVELFSNQADIPAGWNGIERLIKVRRWGYRNGKSFDERTFYLLSKPINSAYSVAKAIQGHWSIENNLHWIKDVNLREDEIVLKDKTMVAMIVYLNNIAVNMLRYAGYKPVKDTLAKFANKVNELHTLFRQ